MMFCLSVDLFLTYCLISFVCILTTIGSFLSYVDSAVGLVVSITVIISFKSHTRTMMSSGLYNYRSMYGFSFLLNLFYWSLAYLWSAVVPKNAPKSSTYPLKFRINDVYSGWLKHPLLPPRPCWPLLPPQPPWPRPRPTLLVLDLLVVSWPRVVVVSPSIPLLPAAGGSVSVSGVVTFPL